MDHAIPNDLKKVMESAMRGIILRLTHLGSDFFCETNPLFLSNPNHPIKDI